MSSITGSTPTNLGSDPLLPFVQGERATSTLPDLSLVIPTFRQASTISGQVEEILTALDGLAITYDVLVVVDGDDDGTGEQLAQIMKERLRVVVLDENVGKGNAVRRGLRSVGGRARAFLDGGGDIPPHCLANAYKQFCQSNAEIVVGSKLHPNSVVEYPLTRRLYSWGYRHLTRLLFGLNVRDTQVGLKIYDAAVVEQVFPHVRTQGFAFDVEALALARRLGFRRIEEAPVVVRNQYPSSIRVGTTVLMFLETLAVWWRLRRFGPDRCGSYRQKLD